MVLLFLGDYGALLYDGCTWKGAAKDSGEEKYKTGEQGCCERDMDRMKPHRVSVTELKQKTLVCQVSFTKDETAMRFWAW